METTAVGYEDPITHPIPEKNIQEKDIITKALKRFSVCEESSREVYKAAQEDLRFRGGNHWPEKLKRDREDKGRPCLVDNRLPTFTRQVTNDHKQNRPQVKIRPVGSGADIETANIVSGLYRSIFNHNGGESAIDTAEWYAVNGSIGWFRLLTKYEDIETFNQSIYYEECEDPFSVFIPMHLLQTVDWSDIPYAFIISEISKEEYEREYPNFPIGDFTPSEELHKEWIKKDTVRIAEYFEIVYDKSMIYKLQDGSITNQLPKDSSLIVEDRSLFIPKVLWRKINCNNILKGGIEGIELPTTKGCYGYIPLIAITGEKYKVDGKVIVESLVRHSKDPQLALDFWKTAMAESIALQIRTPYIGYKGQFEGVEQAWASANQSNAPFLEVNPTTVDGKPAPFPQRQQPATIPTGAAELLRESIDALKSTTGIYDASLGSRGNETSGRAINARKLQGDLSNFHYTDSLVKALRLSVKIILCMIPKIYNLPRILHIIGEDQTDKLVSVNQPNEDVKSQSGIYDFTKGDYGVTIDIGPSYATQRQETVDTLLEFTKSDPQIAIATSDIIARNMDFPASQELSDRLKKMLPPALQDEPKPGDPNAMQQQIQQMGQALQMLQQQNQQYMIVIEKMQNEIEDKEKTRELEIDKAILASETQIEVARLKNQLGEMQVNQQLLLAQINKMESGKQPAEPAPNAESNPPQGEQGVQ